MLNIISRSIVSKNNRGPRKVVINLIQGLKKLGYPFVINAALEATDTIWIHDDPTALEEAMKLPSQVAIIAGPNIYTLPSEIPDTIDTSRIIWIHPAPWTQAFWNTFGTDTISSTVWPAGIDTIQFTPNTTTKKELILVYNKQRANTDTETVCAALDACNEEYEVIIYGKYQEAEYKNLLEKTKAIIWIGRSESQGIALLEALAMDVPALVWDVKSFGQWTGGGHERFTKKQLAFTPVTTTPYFDNRCGMSFTNKTELESILPKFLETLPSFTPRKYILENLSLTKQANAFINIYKEHFNQGDTSLKNSTLSTKKMWRNNALFFYLLTTCKDAIRRIIS